MDLSQLYTIRKLTLHDIIICTTVLSTTYKGVSDYFWLKENSIRIEIMACEIQNNTNKKLILKCILSVPSYLEVQKRYCYVI